MVHDPARSTPQTDAPIAACLTPPAMGGVAVIQVVGGGAPRVVGKCLRSRRPLDLATMDPEEIRLCRWVEGDQVIDDALVAVRQNTGGQFVVDISLHGGPRIVQRALLMLQQAGARIVEPLEMLEAYPAVAAVEREILPLLLKAKTRAVAVWLVEMVQRLPDRVRTILALLDAGQEAPAKQELASLLQAGEQAKALLDGVRVVVVGAPNTGKSTLINSLAGREQAIVSDLPGTTRDWVEHPAAIDGIPVVFVDTAGIHDAKDPIEQEAIRRTHRQAATADLVLTVSDQTTPLQVGHGLHLMMAGDSPSPARVPPVIPVVNKSDLPPHPSWQDVLTAERGLLRISALTSAGLSDLEAKLVEATGLTGWRQNLVAPVTPRQANCSRSALSVLEAGKDGPQEASRWLQNLFGPTGCR